MEATPEQIAYAVELRSCPKCAVPADSPCRTRSGKVTATYHTARFILVPSLSEALAVRVPSGRPDHPGPGMPWTPGPPIHGPVAAAEPAPIRIGYALCTADGQDLPIQVEALDGAHCKRVFSEIIGDRVKIRPEYDNALTMAHDVKVAAPERPVILTVHELRRSARNAAELMALAAALESGSIALELLTGPMAGIHDPKGVGAMLFTVLAATAELERNCDREQVDDGVSRRWIRRSSATDLQ